MLADDPAFLARADEARELRSILERLEQSILGQRVLLERLIIAMLAGGHVLIEGVPGLAKTRAVRAIANVLDLPFRRIQFTPDLLPADLTGTQVYRPSDGTFGVKPGPIVTSVLLADEINRAPAKVQSALLEAMQEGQVTIGEQTIKLPDPFWVLATQNPVEHEGTYPLPEAQLDRFLFKLKVAYPARAAEVAMLDLPDALSINFAGVAFGREDIKRLRQSLATVRVAPSIKGYVVDLVRATREPRSYGLDLAPLIELGASPRASLALLAAARGHALLEGRDYVTPHDAKQVAHDVLRHRVIVSYEADAEGLNVEDLITRILSHIAVP